MFASSMVAFILSAAAVIASDHQARSHHAAIVKRLDNDTSLGRRDTYSGKEMTWYPTNTGPDACTGKNHQDSDFFVAMGYDQFGDGSGCCGRKLRINYKGKSAVATCVDECASCPQWGQIDLTKGLFKYLTGGDLDVGVIYGSWSYVDGNDNGGDNGNDGGKDDAKDDDSPPVKKTTTHRTTSTHKATSTEKKEVAPTSTHHSSSFVEPTSSSSAQPSPSKPSSSDPEPSSSPEDGSPLPSATSGVQNVGSSAGTSSSDSDSGSGADSISGALTGSSSGTASFGTNKLAVAVAALALAVFQAL